MHWTKNILLLLIISKMCVIYILHCKRFSASNFSLLFNPNLGGGNFTSPLPYCWLVTFVPILESLTQTQTGISDFRISGQSLIKENCHNSRTSDDIYMELGPLTKLEEWNKTMSKKLMITSCQQIMTSLSLF